MNFNYREVANNKSFQAFSGVFAILVVIAVIWGVYSYLKKKSMDQPFLIKEPRRGEYLVEIEGKSLLSQGTEKRLNPYQVFSNDKIKPPRIGNGYSYSVWLNIDDWNYKYGQPKHIFHKGDRNAVSVNPGVWLYPNTNNIMIRVDTYGRENNVSKTVSGKQCQFWTSQFPHTHEFTNENYPDKDLGDHNYCRNPDNKRQGAWCLTDDKDTRWESCGIKSHKIPKSMNPMSADFEFNPRDQCDLVNVPVQRWIHLCIVLHNRTLDVYLNGKMTRSCTYNTPPIVNDEDFHITDNDGFKGQISELIYFNRSLSPNEVYSIYNKGYKTFSLYDKLASVTPKVNLNVNVSASVNDNEVGGSASIGN